MHTLYRQQAVPLIFTVTIVKIILSSYMYPYDSLYKLYNRLDIMLGAYHLSLSAKVECSLSRLISSDTCTRIPQRDMEQTCGQAY